MKRKLLFGLTGAAALGLASQLMAAQITTQITIQDNNLGAGFGGGPYGIPLEDNETEPGTQTGQMWDLEAFSIFGNTLYMVGGWNFLAGYTDPVTHVVTRPGDLFIKVGGTSPTGSPTTQGHGTIPNSTYGYNYAVILNNGLGTPATVQTLTPNSVLNTVVYDQFVANPWDYASGATSSSSTPITYTTGQTDAQMLANYGLTLYGGLHNVVTVDLSFLGTVAANTSVWFSYTMECGNDSLKGQYDGGFRTPDGGATLMLLGLGLSALGVVSRKVRKV